MRSLRALMSNIFTTKRDYGVKSKIKGFYNILMKKEAKNTAKNTDDVAQKTYESTEKINIDGEKMSTAYEVEDTEEKSLNHANVTPIEIESMPVDSRNNYFNIVPDIFRENVFNPSRNYFNSVPDNFKNNNFGPSKEYLDELEKGIKPEDLDIK